MHLRKSANISQIYLPGSKQSLFDIFRTIWWFEWLEFLQPKEKEKEIQESVW